MAGPVEWPTVDLLARRARATPDRTALVEAETGRAWSYRALSTGPVDDLAAGLGAAGLEPGDHLGATATPGIRLTQLVHAAARAGAVFVPLPPAAPARVVRERCAAADVDMVVTVEPADSALEPFDGPVLRIDDLSTTGEPAPPHEWNPDDGQWLVFTSGTTGEPRPVRLTAGNLVASAAASAERLGVEPDDRWLACLPTHHVGGLAPLVRTVHDGTAAVVQAGFGPRATAAALDTHKVTGVSLVPTMLTRLLDDGWQPPDALRSVLLGGAPTSGELIDRCEAAGVPVHPTYGATETASQVATATPGEAFEHRGTVGRPLPDTEVEVVDGSGASLPAGEPGELVVSGPTVSPGYYGAPSGDRFHQGAFHTRDAGYLDAAGRLWVTGRLDRAIVTGGETVHPDEVEAALRDHEAVADAAVVGLDDAEWGEIVAALVTGPDPGSIDVSDLEAHARVHLDAVAVPKLVDVVEALPRTPSGTVDRTAVRERLRRTRRREGL